MPTMKAAVVHAFKQPLRIQEVPIPEVVPGSIVVNTTTDTTDSQFQNGPPARVVANAGPVPVRVGTTNGTSTVRFRVTIN